MIASRVLFGMLADHLLAPTHLSASVQQSKAEILPVGVRAIPSQPLRLLVGKCYQVCWLAHITPMIRLINNLRNAKCVFGNRTTVALMHRSLLPWNPIEQIVAIANSSVLLKWIECALFCVVIAPPHAISVCLGSSPSSRSTRMQCRLTDDLLAGYKQANRTSERPRHHSIGRGAVQPGRDDTTRTTPKPAVLR